MSILSRALIAGLLLALFIVILRPDLIATLRPVVEIRQSMGLTHTRTDGPVSYADAVARAAPAVVSVYSNKTVPDQARSLLSPPVLRHFFGDSDRSTSPQDASLGSGVLVSGSGYLLTNYHVIASAETIRVTLTDGRNLPARVVGKDRETDLAVLQVQADQLPSITLGDSAELRVGDVVMAIGNPFMVGQTVTMGIVSATGRSQLGINTIENFIQTDAAINPGNSGGALIDAHGRLVGINSAIFSRSGGSQGIGFAIPTALARGVMEQIIESGAVTRGWLGVETLDLTLEQARSAGLHLTQGVFVARVLEHSPADKAGLRRGDLLTRLDGEPIDDSLDLLDKVTALPPGTLAELTGMRAGLPLSKTVEVFRRPQ